MKRDGVGAYYDQGRAEERAAIVAKVRDDAYRMFNRGERVVSGALCALADEIETGRAPNGEHLGSPVIAVDIECSSCGGCGGHAHSVRDGEATWTECTHGCGWRSDGRAGE